MAEPNNATAAGNDIPTNGVTKKQILLNAFDMSTVGHLSPGQWKVRRRFQSDLLDRYITLAVIFLTIRHTDSIQNPKDRSATKRKLEYWIELAKLLERGGINALFLADTYGGYDTYENSLDNCIRRAAQWPMTDPTIVSIYYAFLSLDIISQEYHLRAASEYDLTIRFSPLVLWQRSRAN